MGGLKEVNRPSLWAKARVFIGAVTARLEVVPFPNPFKRRLPAPTILPSTTTGHCYSLYVAVVVSVS